MSREEIRRWMMARSDRELHLRYSIEQKRGGQKYGTYVAEVLSRAVVVGGVSTWGSRPWWDHLMWSPS